MDDGRLRELCRVGYRSQRLIRLAHRFAYESLEAAVDALLDPSRPSSELYALILSLDGFGPFAAANATALLGRYDVHPFDSETVRHMREHHGVDRQFKLPSGEVLKRARAHYTAERYGAAIFLVYWYELWCGYEQRAKTRAEQWTQTQFSSFSNGGQQLVVADAPKSHSLLVAQQTRKRKQGTAGTSPKRRSTAKARAVRSEAVIVKAEEDEEEEKENVPSGLQEGSAEGGEAGKAGRGKKGKITGMLKVVKRTVETKPKRGSVKNEETLAMVTEPSERRVTRTQARLAQAALN